MNYRGLWGIPVTVRILHLDREEGGLRIKGPGGGMQTKSLDLEDKMGQKWALRTIDKSVDKAMDAEGIKNKTIRSMAQKMLSASNPYGTLTISPMARALGIPSTGPKLVWVPDDPLLGKYRSDFANTLCLLERREPVLFAGDEVVSTEKMLTALTTSKDYRLDEKMLLQARLLDMLCGTGTAMKINGNGNIIPTQDTR